MKKWITDILDSEYCTFLVSLFATILSFADPMTDILTLVEFYRDDHKTWFAVGLVFVVLPCVAFLFVMHDRRSLGKETLLCGFNPFSAAWLRLKICWRNFKKCCWDDNADDEDEDQDLDKHSVLARLLEAVLESAPQFIIQLYAMSVQQEPVKIIQMISVPVSFLSLSWAFTAYNTDFGIFKGCNVKQKFVLFVNYLFLLSSRLFAVTFFTITYKWWIISVLMIHSVLILIADTIWSWRIKRVFQDCSSWGDVNESALCFCLHWLRDDMSPTRSDKITKRARMQQKMLALSNILFVIENITMILIFYRFSTFSNTWYSLPVTVCVCSFSVIGAVARVAHVCFVTKQSNREQCKQSNTRVMVQYQSNGPVQKMTTQPKLVMSQGGESTKGVSRFDMMVEYVSYV